MTDQEALTDQPDPSVALDLRAAARHLVRHPLVLAEADPSVFATIRRNEQALDRWFTQRFGYRLQVTADTARLFKSTIVSRRRPLITATTSSRDFAPREYTMLALALAAVAAGPAIISLHDLVAEIRSAATDANVSLNDDATDRRAVITALRWMIDHGVAAELHDQIDRYISDGEADAVLSIRADRVALLPLPALARAETADDLIDRSERRQSTRQWMRALLLEEPVLYRSDLDDDEWAELRRRLGQESVWFDEMFNLQIEARAEGVLALDPDGVLTDRRFPAGGTVGHAALLLIDTMLGNGDTELSSAALVKVIAKLATEHRRYWSKGADKPDALARAVVGLLDDHRLIEPIEGGVKLLPAAWRYAVSIERPDRDDDDDPDTDIDQSSPPTDDSRGQESLW